MRDSKDHKHKESLSQIDRFKATAKELEADGDEKSFDGLLKKLAKKKVEVKK